MSAWPLPPLIDLSDPAVMRERAEACGRARAGHWFWLPCPLCGLEFSGLEHNRMLGYGSEDRPASMHMPGDPREAGRAICPFCTAAGRGADPRWRWEPYGAVPS